MEDLRRKAERLSSLRDELRAALSFAQRLAIAAALVGAAAGLALAVWRALTP